MLQTVRQILYIATLALVAITGATGALDAQTTAGVVAQLLALVAAGTAVLNVPIPKTGSKGETRPSLNGQTIAGLVLDVLTAVMPQTGRHTPAKTPPPNAPK